MSKQTRQHSILQWLLFLMFGHGPRNVSEQASQLPTQPQYSSADDREVWHHYWQVQGQPWRTEPQIDEERQKYLTERRRITPNIEQGIYPFKSEKLSRADVEWLLATHENGCGPVDWSDEGQRKRKGLDLRGADLCHVDLHNLPLACTYGGPTWITTTQEWLNTTPEQQNAARVHLEGANLSGTHLEGANLVKAYLQGSSLTRAHLAGADLSGAHLEGTYLIEVHLEETNLTWTHLERAILSGAYLDRANLKGAFFDTGTRLDNVTLGNKSGGFVSLAEVRWGGVDLSVVNWGAVNMLGDEREVYQWKISAGKRTRQERVKEEKLRIEKYKTAARAYRQLATALGDQGMYEKAGRFAYRGQLVRRKGLWREVFQSDSSWRLRILRLLDFIFSLLLDVLAGYGYKPQRCLGIYLLVIAGFTTAYYVLGQIVGPHFSPLGAFVFSVTSFHGRGFFPGGIELDDPITTLAALEAVVGLFTEVTFIAMVTQRFLK